MLRAFDILIPPPGVPRLGTPRRLLSGPVLLALLLAAPVLAEPAEHGLTPRPRYLRQPGEPALPDLATFPVQLVLDDDSAEGVFWFSGATPRQFLWFNRFASPGPFFLEEIWALFPSGMHVPVGGDVQLAVYLDPDGDPSSGAQFLATYTDEVVQAADGDTFSVYPLADPLAFAGGGDL